MHDGLIDRPHDKCDELGGWEGRRAERGRKDQGCPRKRRALRSRSSVLRNERSGALGNKVRADCRDWVRCGHGSFKPVPLAQSQTSADTARFRDSFNIDASRKPAGKNWPSDANMGKISRGLASSSGACQHHRRTTRGCQVVGEGDWFATSAMGQGLPLRLRCEHVWCTRDS
jgi:hypothetical protein